MRISFHLCAIYAITEVIVKLQWSTTRLPCSCPLWTLQPKKPARCYWQFTIPWHHSRRNSSTEQSLRRFVPLIKGACVLQGFPQTALPHSSWRTRTTLLCKAKAGMVPALPMPISERHSLCSSANEGVSTDWDVLAARLAVTHRAFTFLTFSC